MRASSNKHSFTTQYIRFFVILLLMVLLFSVLLPAKFAQAKPAPATTPLATATPGPNITIDVGTIGFTVNNNGDDMTTDYSYTMNRDGSPIQSGTFRLNHGGSQNYYITGEGNFVLYIKDDLGADLINATLSFYFPKITAVGNVVSGVATFVITNSGSDMPAAYTYQVKDSGGSVLKTNSFLLSAGESQNVSVSGVLGVLTLSMTDDKGTTSTLATVTVTLATGTAIETVTSTDVIVPTSTSKPYYVAMPSETSSNLGWIWYTRTPTATSTATMTITQTPSPIPSTVTGTSTSSVTMTQTLVEGLTQTSTIPVIVPEEEPRNTIPVWVFLLIGFLLLGLIVFWFFRLRKKQV
jgi:hypothetical protein